MRLPLACGIVVYLVIPVAGAADHRVLEGLSSDVRRQVSTTRRLPGRPESGHGRATRTEGNTLCRGTLCIHVHTNVYMQGSKLSFGQPKI